MKKLIERFASLVKGSISGFDRVVFKGFIIPLMTAQGAMSFCRANGILNKEYKNWMMKQSRHIVDSAEQYGKANCGQGITPIPTWRIRKEQVAHERQQAYRARCKEQPANRFPRSPNIALPVSRLPGTRQVLLLPHRHSKR